MHLNGKTIAFTAAGAFLNITTTGTVTINGEVPGSEITKNVSNGTNEKLIGATDTFLNIIGGQYSMYGTYTTAAVAIRTETATGSITMSEAKVLVDVSSNNAALCTQIRGSGLLSDCVFSANNKVNRSQAINFNVKAADLANTDLFAKAINCTVEALGNGVLSTKDTVGVYSNIPMYIENCNVYARNPAQTALVVGAYAVTKMSIVNCNIKADGFGDTTTEAMYAVCAVVFNNSVDNEIIGGYYYGTREALVARASCRINGGVFEGCQHGGAYISSTDVKIKNATFRNIPYTGDCGWNDPHYGVIYCGSSSGDVAAYFDNCQFDSTIRASYGITAKYSNTKVYLSNSVINGNFENDLRADTGNTIYIGKNVVYDTVFVNGGTIDTTTYADQEFGFETTPTNCENLVEVKTGLLQNKLEQTILHTPQNLTEEQKAQARSNIDASGIYIGEGDMPEGYSIQIIPDEEPVNL